MRNCKKFDSLYCVFIFSVLCVLSGCIVRDKNESARVGQNAGGGESVAADTVLSAESKITATVEERFVAIDNVCAWPNLTLLRDGTIIATIFNKPNHGVTEGSVECWASRDGRFWEKRSTPAEHEPGTNRIHYAVGLANNGDLLTLASGWSLNPAEEPVDDRQRGAIIRVWVSRSSDGGRSWTVDKQAFPVAEPGRTDFIPFGDITPGADGSLRAVCYAVSRDGRRTFKASMFRSDDDGRTWKRMSTISDGHNETASFHLGGGKWIAAARNEVSKALDLFRSEDDGRTWRLDKALTRPGQVPADLLRLRDGRLLLSYGNRIPGQFGAAAKISQDDGATWSEAVLLVSDLTKGDCGYPSSVQLPGGEILTAYYAASVASHQRYHMGVVNWKLSDSPAN